MQPAPHVTVAAANSVSWKDLVHVVGATGVLTAVGVTAGPCYHHVRITIDGELLAQDALAGTGSSVYANNGIGVGLPFGSEMRVEMRDDSSPSALARFWAAYVVWSPPSYRAASEIAEIDGHRVRIEQMVYDGGEYTVTTAAGPALLSRVRLSRDVLVSRPADGGGVAVELGGEVRLEAVDREPVVPEWRQARVDVRPLSRATAVGHVSATELGEAGGSFDATLVLPAPGDYEAVASLDDYANLPTSFRVL